MTEITLSAGELAFLRETFDLVLEEFEGIEEGRDDLDNYVLTTGALENSQIAYDLIVAWQKHLHKCALEEEEGEVNDLV